MSDDLKALIQKSISQIGMGEKPDLDLETAKKMLTKFEEKTTYGKKGGVGPTKGKKYVLYTGTFPDGTQFKKRSYHVNDPVARCHIYQTKGVWYYGGLWPLDSDQGRMLPVGLDGELPLWTEVKRVDKG